MLRADGARDEPLGGWGGSVEEDASRRVVTVLFADLVASTTLGERMDPERLRTVQARYFAALRPVIERHGGTVEKFIGDAVMAVFGVPVVREDDALRAARAALELAPALRTLDAEVERRLGMGLKLRVGLHTGEVVADARTDALVTGDAVNVAARLQAAAEPGTILLSAATLALLRGAAVAEDAAPVPIRNRGEPVLAARLLGLTGDDPRSRPDAPFVGRAAERATLDAAFQAAAAGSTRLVTVLGAPGVGKSRIVRETLAGLDGRAEVLRGRCLSYGDGITWWPVVEILHAVAGVGADAPAATVADALGRLTADLPQAERVEAILGAIAGVTERTVSADDVSWAVRRVLAARAADRPVCLVVEDIHWAESALLDLLETVVDWSPDLRVLVVATARPELLDLRPGWAQGRDNAMAVPLEAFGPADAEALLDALTGAGVLPGPLRARIHAAAEGNALYLEELVAHLVDEGRLVRGEDGTAAIAGSAAEIEVPPTITALVAARIDALPAGERAIAEIGSVIGRVFERGAVVALAADADRRDIGPALLGLARRGVVRPAGTGIDGDDAFRFRHILLRDAAYARLPKARRATLHERAADWLDAAVEGRAGEHVEILAHHLATAAELRLELDPFDDEGVGPLAARAVRAIRAAIERAQQTHAWPEVVRLADRALALLPVAVPADGAELPAELDLVVAAASAEKLSGSLEASVQRLRGAGERSTDPLARAELRLLGATTLGQAGDHLGAVELLDTGLGEIPEGDPMVRGRVLAARARVLRWMGRWEECERDSRAAIALAGSVGTPAWLADAWVTLFAALDSLRRTDEREAVFREALVVVERSGDPETTIRLMNNRGACLMFEGREDEAIDWYQRGLARAVEFDATRSPMVGGILANLFDTTLHRGQVTESQRWLDELERMTADGSGPDGPDLDGGLAMLRATLACFRGDQVAARSHLDAVITKIATRGAAAYLVRRELLRLESLLALLAGDPVTIVRLVRAAELELPMEHETHAAAMPWILASAAADRAEAARRDGDASALAAAIAELEDAVRAAGTFSEHPSWPRTAYVTAPLRLLDAEHARGLGRPSVEHWRVALAELDARGWAWYAWQARHGLARALAAEDPDSEAARDAIEDAVAHAEAMDAPGLADRARALRPGTPRTS
ncbi:MAG: adenylate/guanylate cyclase domain-containing protein [Chloroflexota bacterium]